MSFEDYADLAGTGFQGGGGEITSPEEEFFHSVYVSGSDRKNHINIVEQIGKFQIRGVQYNLEELNMIIVHTKDILTKIKSENRRDTTECFSYKEASPPWYGTSKLGDGNPRQCPQTSAERAVNDFCSPCRAQIVLAGVYCKADGTPILTEENKPIFVFLRGKGMKYSNVSNYLNDAYKEDLKPLFEPVTEQSKEFEKSVVNNKRFVTKITKGQEQSKYGSNVNIFILTRGVELPKESVMSILKLSKQTLEKFNDKFDWSKGKLAVGYGQSKAIPEGVLPIDGSKSEEEGEEESTEETLAPESGKVFSFDDINF